MKWKKLGNIFCPNGEFEWMQTHASNPVAHHVEGDIYKIYFSTRDTQNRSSIGFVEIDITNPKEILKISENPVLTFGDIGLFDDRGASMGCIANIDGKNHLYYLGWTITDPAPWHNSIGLAKENEDGVFDKISLAPLLDRCDADPYSLSYPWVLKDGDIFHMWYGSNLKWGREQEEMAHLIKYAWSNDGFNWNREGKVAIPFANEEEYAISKPCVIKDKDCWKMWFSYRGKAYRIGYAESKDGISWDRKDDRAGITVSEEGWDSDSIEYPCVFDHKGKRYMLYNGNKYGLTGFGLAVNE